MARLIRPIRHWSPQLHHQYCIRVTSDHFLSPNLPPPPPSLSTSSVFLFRSYSTTSSPPRRRINLRRRRPAPPNALVPTVLREEDEGDGDRGLVESDSKKSRNQQKREARRAVRWGVELASFSNDQIKRILRAASLDEDVLDALMLVKRLGPDVREGKRRQFNYIGKLLREVEPNLMDTLIQATKHGDQKTLQALVSSVENKTDDVGDGDDHFETQFDDDAERSEEYISTATRWFDGLISKNMEVTNEVYSLQSVDFDRQELRKLVRKVHLVQEQRKTITEETEKEISAAVMAAEKSLTRFLHSLAKQMPNGQTDSYL